ncbi:MAG: diadenylate cyclase CdaA [Ruminococcus sp.]|nr:diadenylate cyclase CdaA [Ruminococcus sp.]
MEAFYEYLDAFISVIKSITFFDILDIAILAFLLYKGIQIARETRAGQLVKGIILIAACYFVADFFELKAMKYLLDTFFRWGFLAIVILFQPEFRRVLERVGRSKVARITTLSPLDRSGASDVWSNCIDVISESAATLSSTKTGALIVCERMTKLGEQIDTGTILNCVPSEAVFGNIFFPNTPLHDGAVIIRNGYILAAGCFLPKPQKEELINKQLGSRHRAAIGMSEVSDAIIVVVSEETGNISVAEDGVLTRGYNKESLKKHLISKLLPKEDENKHQGIAERVKRRWKKEKS